ncbi:STM4504/CBY_0614 family protein [Pseudomonas chlororaphis]|uniref:STM4504/CBY_0614 family protein n=1 Tax=Pseudomonas chlororaphis TaxID=587753 RepID=UPI003C278C4E
MAVTDLFSKRQQRLRGEVSDVYVYDKIPIPLRIQLLYMVDELLGPALEYYKPFSVCNQIFKAVVKTLRLEYGKRRISSAEENDEYHELVSFIKNEENVDRLLDAIELIVANVSGYSGYDESLVEFVGDLNIRFREHAVGYEIINGEVVRVDSRFMHSQVVKPSIQFLNQPGFEGAQQEFIRAYEYYRHARHKEAINEAVKSVESTMRAICTARNWRFKTSDSAKRLIVVCQENNLFPSYYQSHLAALASLMEGVVSIRNNESAHGQGPKVREVDADIVAYGLHMAAAAVLMLASLHTNQP